MSDYQLDERRNFAKANYIPVREVIFRNLFLLSTHEIDIAREIAYRT